MSIFKFGALLLLSLSYFSIFSQNYNPRIQQGTAFQYEFWDKMSGKLVVDGSFQDVDNGRLSFYDTLHLKGVSQVYHTIISKKAMERGDCMKPPREDPRSVQNGVYLFILSDNETDHCFSRSFLKNIKKDKTAVYGGITYFQEEDPAFKDFELNGLKWDVVHIISANKQKRFTILNNEEYPLILQSSSEDVNSLLTKFNDPPPPELKKQ